MVMYEIDPSIDEETTDDSNLPLYVVKIQFRLHDTKLRGKIQSIISTKDQPIFIIPGMSQSIMTSGLITRILGKYSFKCMPHYRTIPFRKQDEYTLIPINFSNPLIFKTRNRKRATKLFEKAPDVISQYIENDVMPV